MVLIEYILDAECTDDTLGFRPLAGIMVLIDLISCLGKAGYLPVSVPLRGLWFLSKLMFKPTEKQYEAVSVPLRGLWFLSNMVFPFPSFH